MTFDGKGERFTAPLMHCSWSLPSRRERTTPVLPGGPKPPGRVHPTRERFVREVGSNSSLADLGSTEALSVRRMLSEPPVGTKIPGGVRGCRAALASTHSMGCRTKPGQSAQLFGPRASVYPTTPPTVEARGWIRAARSMSVSSSLTVSCTTVSGPLPGAFGRIGSPDAVRRR